MRNAEFAFIKSQIVGRIVGGYKAKWFVRTNVMNGNNFASTIPAFQLRPLWGAALIRNHNWQ